MRDKIISKRLAAFAAMALLCSGALVTTFNPLSASAQPPCPTMVTDDAVNNPANPAWDSAAVTVTVAGGCQMEICYGCRCSNPPLCTNFDYVITQISVDSACWAQFVAAQVPPWTPTQEETNLQDSAFAELFQANPCGFPCAACPDTSNRYGEDAIACTHTTTWRYFNVATQRWEVYTVTTYCPDHGWCVNLYHMCCDAQGNKHYTLISSTPFNGNCKDEGCELICPDPLPGSTN